jgi:hypothetical protein
MNSRDKDVHQLWISKKNELQLELNDVTQQLEYQTKTRDRIRTNDMFSGDFLKKKLDTLKTVIDELSDRKERLANELEILTTVDHPGYSTAVGRLIDELARREFQSKELADEKRQQHKEMIEQRQLKNKRMQEEKELRKKQREEERIKRESKNRNRRNNQRRKKEETPRARFGDNRGRGGRGRGRGRGRDNKK